MLESFFLLENNSMCNGLMGKVDKAKTLIPIKF